MMQMTVGKCMTQNCQFRIQRESKWFKWQVGDVRHKIVNLEFRVTGNDTNDSWEMHNTKMPIENSEGHTMMQMAGGRCMTQNWQFIIQRDTKWCKWQVGDACLETLP